MDDSTSGDMPSPTPSPDGRGDDPEIEALLDFEPVPRTHKRKDGWTPALQRIFIAKLAQLGSVNAATEALGKNRYGVEKLYKSAGADSFRAAWDKAIALFEEREAKRIAAENAPFAGVKPPFVDRRRKDAAFDGPLPGQVMNEHGEWEDEASLMQRMEDVKDSISAKLLRCRRLFLAEISSSPGKRAAFEILTSYPIDWDKAARMEPQPDEPYNRANQRQPDMILTAENGWSFGEHGYGEDKKAELRAAVDAHRAEEGLPAVNWNEDEEDDETPSSSSPTRIGDLPSGDSLVGSSRPKSRGAPSAHESEPGPRLRRI